MTYTFLVILTVWFSEYQTSIDWPYTETTFVVRVARTRLGQAQQANEVWKQTRRLIVGGEIRGPPAIPLERLLPLPRGLTEVEQRRAGEGFQCVEQVRDLLRMIAGDS